MAGHKRVRGKWVCPSEGEPSEHGSDLQSSFSASEPFIPSPCQDKGKGRATSSDKDYRSNDEEEDEDVEMGHSYEAVIDDFEEDADAPMQLDEEEPEDDADEAGADGENRDTSSPQFQLSPSAGDERGAGPLGHYQPLQRETTVAHLLRTGGHWRNPHFVEESSAGPSERIMLLPGFVTPPGQTGRVAFADITYQGTHHSDDETSSGINPFQSVPLAQLLLDPDSDLERAFREFLKTSDPHATIFKVPLSRVDNVRQAATNVGLYSGILQVFVKQEDEDDDGEESMVSVVIGADVEGIDEVMDMHRASQCSIPQIIVQGPRSRPDLRYNTLLSAGAIGGLAVFGGLLALTSRF